MFSFWHRLGGVYLSGNGQKFQLKASAMSPCVSRRDDALLRHDTSPVDNLTENTEPLNALGENFEPRALLGGRKDTK